LFVLFCLFSLYWLCVNVYCTSATGWRMHCTA
jgi:hypothetical protein